MRALSLAVAAWLAAATPALAQLPPLDQARSALAEGRWDEAQAILDTVDEMAADRNDLDFLRGTLAMARGDLSAAIDRFRAILSRDPSLNRVRLDLARALFLDFQDEAARHHFSIARSRDLPPEVARKVDAFLDQIRRRKRWSLDVSLGIAPDSNVNGATDARRVDLYGLPFTLDDDARKTSGIGVAAVLGGSTQFALGPDTRLVAGARLSTMDYAGQQFDDRVASAQLGPRFLLGGGSELTVSATAARRWYGGEGYSTGLGARVDGETLVSPRLMVSGSVAVQGMDYDRVDALDGPVVTLGLGVTYALDEASLVRLDLALMREQADQAAFRDTQFHAGLSYYRELPGGFAVTLGAGVTRALYDERMAAFDRTRADDSVSARVAVSNRHLDLFGFTPVLAYVHTERFSTLDLYDFSRDRVEIAFKRNF